MNLVTLADLIPGAIINLRYATANNFVGRALYEGLDQQARLDEPVAGRLQHAAELFRKQNLRLVIWDAYRPLAVQQQLRAVNDNQQYVALESNHCLGRAVDISLAHIDGGYLDMGTDFDEFTPLAHVDAPDLSTAQRENRALLQRTMIQAGFQPWPFEWWHFDYPI